MPTWRHVLRITAATGLIALLGGFALPSATAASFPELDTTQTEPGSSEAGSFDEPQLEEVPADGESEGVEPEATEAEAIALNEAESEALDAEQVQPDETLHEDTGLAADSAAMVPADAGITLPTSRDQAIGDVLGRGYEQIVRVHGSKVEITEPATRGGEVIHAFEAGTRNDFPTRHYYGGYQLGDIAKQGGSHVAVLGQNIYVSTFVLDPERSVNRSEVRKYRADGSLEYWREFPNDHAVTALSAVRHQGKDLLAIGLNQGGVRVAHTDRQGLPDFRELHLDWNGGCFKCFARNMVTALKLYTADDGRHRLMLVAGRFTYGTEAVVATDLDFQRDPHGDVKNAGIEMWRNNKRPDNLTTWEWPDVLEAGTFGPSNRTQVGISWPASRRTTFVDGIHGANFTSNDAQETTAIRFFKDADDEHRVAIRRGGSSVIAGVNASGQLYYTQWNLNDSSISSAAPGYRAWSVTFENRSSRELALRTFADAKRERGCFYGGSQLKGVERTLPSEATHMPAGRSAGPFGTAQRTVGEGCTGDHPGALYVQVDVGDSGNRRVAKLLGDRDGLRVDSQVGAGLVDVSTERHGLWGVRIVVTDRLGEPTLRTGPTLGAKRLTPLATAPDDGDVHDANRPVFRFTAGGTVWHVPGADSSRSAVTLPVPTAQGSLDGVTWVDLGTVTSPLAPTKVGADMIEIGVGEFYWQAEAGAIRYRHFRLVLPDGTPSNSIDTDDANAVPAPAPVDVEVSAVSMTSIGTSPRANGLDQVPIRVSVLGKGGQAYDTETHRELYDRLYFRDINQKKLITGLGNPNDRVQLVMLSHQAGQYANGTAGTDANAMTIYASTTMDYRNPSIAPYLKLSGGKGAKNTNSITVQVAPPTKLSSKGLAGEGLSVDGCVEGACVLTEPTEIQPALYGPTQATISMQFRTPAIHGSDSLPLTDTRAEERQLFSDPMRHVSGKASLVQPAKFGANASITTYLLTHGERVLAENHLVKTKG